MSEAAHPIAVPHVGDCAGRASGSLDITSIRTVKEDLLERLEPGLSRGKDEQGWLAESV